MGVIRPLAGRLLEHSIPVPEAGCWLWLAGTNNKGYGTTSDMRAGLLAHRASWMLHRGPIPEGLAVLHKCDTPACINPDHLFLGTIQDNNADMFKKGRHFTPPRLSVCKHGHPYSGDNVYEYRRDGQARRACRACLVNNSRKFMQKRKAAQS